MDMLKTYKLKPRRVLHTSYAATIILLILSFPVWGVWTELGKPSLGHGSSSIGDLRWKLVLAMEWNEPVDLGKNVEFITYDGVDALVRTIIGSGAFNSDETIIAVTHVVFNRVRQGGFGGNSIRDVVLSSNSGKTGSSLTEFPSWHYKNKRIDVLSISKNSNLYKRVFSIVRDTILGRYDDNTNGAVYYMVKGEPVNKFCRNEESNIKIQNYIFCGNA